MTVMECSRERSKIDAAEKDNRCAQGHIGAEWDRKPDSGPALIGFSEYGRRMIPTH
jgi:hypothetical protein